MVESKIRTDVSILYGGTGASVTPEKRIPGKQRNMKSPVMSPPRKDTVPYQDREKIFLDINHYLMMRIIQTVHNMTLMILQIIHVTGNKIM